MGQLVERSGGRLKAIDEKDAYFRLQEGEDEPGGMYELLKWLLRGPREG
jgi:hypothetical protein